MQIANGRPMRTGISSLLFFSSSGDDYSIRSIRTRRVIYAILFPRHKRNRFAEVRARRRVILSCRRFTRVPQILDQIISSVAGQDALVRDSKLVLSYFLRRSCHRGFMQKTRPSRCHNRWKAKSAFVFPRLTSPPKVLAFFILGRFKRLFSLTVRDKSPRQPRHERFFLRYVTLCVIRNDEARKKND